MTDYIHEKDLNTYYLIRTKDKPHMYRVGAKKQKVPKMYLLGSARGIVKDNEEIVEIISCLTE